MKIGILGFGTVGGGVRKIITAEPALHRQLSVAAVWVRPEKLRPDDPVLTNDYAGILADPTIEVVVETLGGLHPAREMILQALNAHKDVVTANKAVLATYMDELTVVAQANGVQLCFEPSVAGGIPWLTNLQRAKRIDTIRSIRGIFNGTSNFILQTIMEQHCSAAEALALAQNRGYAEADPSADLDGDDIVNKLCISADLAYNMVVKPQEIVAKIGIRQLLARDVHYFAKQGQVIKLIGQIERLDDNQLAIWVEPTLLSVTDVCANVNGNLNYVELNGATIGPLGFLGQGAGELPTAHALIQDLLDLTQHQYHPNFTAQQSMAVDNNQIIGNYIVRTTLDLTNQPGYQLIDNDYWQLAPATIHQVHQNYQNLLIKDPHAFLLHQAGE